ncbi:MAG: O-methyltransferase [Prosthecobacter sp.]
MRLRNLFRPLYLAGRLQNWLYEKRHPDHPWLAPDAIAWLDANLRPDMQGFEWGSGRSTLWFAKRLASLTSIESDATWFQQVARMVHEAALTNVDLRHIPLDHPDADTYQNEYDPLPRNPATILDLPDASLDFVVVDGWYRPVCARAALPKLKPGGILLIDNTDWNDPPHIHVPENWPLVHRSRNVMTETSIWMQNKTERWF